MESERRSRVREVFDVVVERPPAERAAYLDTACGDDTGLRAEVESLIEAYQDDPAFLERPAGDVTALATEIGGVAAAGTRIGPYRIVRRIGAGGMGAVYLAVRDDEQYRKEVAVKLVKRGMESESILRRFKAERQILASLDHPNIARLLDGGITEDGRPYFVMEYIDSAPIDRYCQEQNLGLRQRLELFRDVCATVHYAHQNLVVHRDLKPGNIQVTEGSRVKLLDFGIAKLLAPGGPSDTTLHTATGRLLMTPDFASPEQVRGSAITTASDVYALGVLLYLLLTERRPFQLVGLAPHELSRVICENDPEPPSATAPRLRNQLRGDLDAIVAMAMRKEPALRYSSARELSDDIRRHLVGQPVVAARDSRGYRLRKFVRRHRTGVAAAVLVAGSLVAGVLTASRQAQVATAERDRAESEAKKAAAVATFLKDLLASAHPAEAKGEALTVRELVDQAAASLEAESAVASTPVVSAELHLTIGRTYVGLGLYDQAAPHFERALAFRTRVLGEDDPGVVEAMKELGLICYFRGDLRRAEELMQRALALSRRVSGERNRATLGLMRNLANIYGETDRLEEGLRLSEQTLELQREVLGEEDLDTMHSLNNVGTYYWALGRYEEAEEMFKTSLEAQLRTVGEDDPWALSAMNNLGLVYRAQKKYEEAETTYLRLMELRERLLGHEHPDTLTVMGNLATLYLDIEQIERAESLAIDALEGRRRALGDEHRDTIESMITMSDVYRARNDYERAERTAMEAVAASRKVLGTSHEDTRLARYALAQALAGRGRIAQAVALGAEVYEGHRAALGPEHPYTMETAEFLAKLDGR